MTVPTATPALVGIGCRLPGDVHGPAAFWEFLVEGRDAVAPMPEHRWKVMRDLLAPEDRPEQPWRAGALADIDGFDHGFFGISAEEAAVIDAQQRLLLEVVVDALYDAGMSLESVASRRIGVYVGAAAPDHATLAFAAGERPGMLAAGGIGASMLSARVAHCLDLHGPAVTVDTACSSALTATHQACRDLAVGDVDTAIVAGVNLLQNPLITRAFVDGGVLAPDGRCKPFDAAADGYVRSEGVAAVVLTHWGETLPERDRVYALLRGSHINTDGHSRGGLFAPSSQAQAALLRDTYAVSDIGMDEVDYVEAHGTGTRAGDRVEATALAGAFARPPEQPLWVGSVKSNLGHTESAAGLVGLIKTALSLHHGRIPATLHHTQPRPALATLPLEVVTEARPWPAQEQRVAGVSSFGYGGTNAHAVLTSPPGPQRSSAGAATPEAEPAGPVVLPLSAATAQGVAETAQTWAEHLDEQADLAATAALATHGRDHRATRAAVIADSVPAAREALTALAAGRTPPEAVGPHTAARQRRMVFVFPGQGGHDPAMGTLLAQRFPEFAATVERVQAALARHEGHEPWTPGREPRGVAGVQQATFTVQVALAEVWRTRGVIPEMVVGHSLGEVAAAHVAGVLSLDDAARLVCARSAVLADAAAEGGLLATALDREQVTQVLAEVGGQVSVAADNGPGHTILTGPHEVLTTLRDHLEERGVFARYVAESPPAHSRFLDPYLNDFAASIAGLHPQAGHVGMVSTATAETVAGEYLDTGYWTRQLRVPVQLHSAIRHLAEQTDSAFVEISPRSVLSHAIEDTLTHHHLPGATVAPGSSSTGDEHTRLLAAFAGLYTRGHTPVWPTASRWRPAELPPPHWHRDTGTDATPAAPLADALATAAPEQRRALVVEAIRGIVADLSSVPLTQADYDAELTAIGLASRDLLVLRAQLRDLHPALAQLDAATIYRAATINALADTLLELLPTPAPEPVEAVTS
ncbi:type I polyketide synthase [Salinactinospora qingdaonensis]|uniref:Ketosynthase family 3 (KS3) domain-containing protein n=1 Tax=Salinactinospora qingdaonensis TaxID=702744 RepID=A0ABP7FVM7_9ACTN